MMIPVRHSRRARTLEERLGPAEPPNAPKPGPRIPRITRLMALAIKLQDMVDRGEIQDYVDIAQLGHITRARASQIMNLTLLAPDIQEEILDWNAPAGSSKLAERHIRSLTKIVCWTAQRKAWVDSMVQRTNAGCAAKVAAMMVGSAFPGDDNRTLMDVQHAV